MQVLNSGYVFLAGGNISDTYNIDKKYFQLHETKQKILYIPIALGDDKHESCIKWFNDLLTHHNQNDLSFDAIRKKDAIPDLSNYKSVYLGGGNTYDLLEFVNKTGLDLMLLEYVKQGGIVYGGSAGAMILGKDTRTAEEENLYNSKVHKGLNILNGYSVICHYNSQENKKIFNISEKIKSRILTIPNNGAISIDYKKRTITPFSPVYIFNNKNRKELKRECTFSEIDRILS